VTREELYADVWAALPARKHLLGKRRAVRIIDKALARWPTQVLLQCDQQQADVVGKYMCRGLVREMRQEVGMGFFAAIILSALISEIIKRLLAHWLSNRAAMLEAMR